MAFPISPANNQITLVNGIEYIYNTSKGAWYRYGDATANVITANTFQALSSVIFPDGTIQTTAATGIDSYARTTANTNATNITIIQGVDNTQNTRITIAEGVDIGQNTRMSIIEGVDLTQNNNITIATNAATAAFAQANATAGGLITANARITVVEGVDTAQNTRIGIIEGVNTTQNTNITIIQGVDLWQNTEITAASALAQGAFARANSGARATTSNTTPTGNSVGDLWLSLTDETLYMYSYDGVSNNWVDISGPILRSSNIVVQYTITANVV